MCKGLILIRTNIGFWLLLSQPTELRMHWFLLTGPLNLNLACMLSLFSTSICIKSLCIKTCTQCKCWGGGGWGGRRREGLQQDTTTPDLGSGRRCRCRGRPGRASGAAAGSRGGGGPWRAACWPSGSARPAWTQPSCPRSWGCGRPWSWAAGSRLRRSGLRRDVEGDAEDMLLNHFLDTFRIIRHNQFLVETSIPLHHFFVYIHKCKYTRIR